MRILSKLLSALFALLGAAAAALAIFLAMNNLDSTPVLLTPAREAQDRVAQVLEAVAQGDFDTAGTMLEGTPDLGVNRKAADPVGQLIWDAFLDSFTYELVGDCYATHSGVAQNVKITCLDMGSVTANLRQRSQDLLAQRVAEAADTAQVYDENNEYREEFVLAVLYDAAKAALAEDGKQLTMEFTIDLIFRDGGWQIIPDGELLKAISGGIVK